MTEKSAPAGWYPDASGTTRWWDGREWTERTQGAESAASDEGAAAAASSGNTGAAIRQEAPATLNGSTSGPIYKRKWAVGLAATIAGLVIGAAAASGAPVEDSPEYKSVKSDLVSAQTDTDGLKAEMAPMKKRVASADAREEGLDDRASALDSREADLKSESAAVKKREKSVGIVEKEIELNTLTGDGMYAVGDDIKAGTYKTKGGAGCYYAVLRDTKGGIESIINNSNISGPGIVSVAKGQYLELSGCSERVRK